MSSDVSPDIEIAHDIQTSNGTIYGLQAGLGLAVDL